MEPTKKEHLSLAFMPCSIKSLLFFFLQNTVPFFFLTLFLDHITATATKEHLFEDYIYKRIRVVR